MANGGIIGPVNTVNAEIAEIKTTVTSSTPSAVTTQPYTTTVDYIIVAGGGAGGGGESRSGGGGAGGYKTATGVPVTGGAALGAVVIGAGGSGSYTRNCRSFRSYIFFCNWWSNCCSNWRWWRWWRWSTR